MKVRPTKPEAKTEPAVSAEITKLKALGFKQYRYSDGSLVWSKTLLKSPFELVG